MEKLEVKDMFRAGQHGWGPAQVSQGGHRSLQASVVPDDKARSSLPLRPIRSKDLSPYRYTNLKKWIWTSQRTR